MSELRKYGVLLTTAKAIQFDLVAPDGVDLITTATFATGDVKISKDGGAEANTTNLPTDEGSGYRLILTATELTASRVKIFIIDQTGTKVWLDIMISVDTYGNASAMHAFDLDLAEQLVDVSKISGDATAADNLELQYDTTGLTGDTFPATQASVGNLAVGSAAISIQAESYSLTTGTQSSGTISDTETRDGAAHQHTDTAGTLDLYYQFDVTGAGVATEVETFGRINGAGDDLVMEAYYWGGTSWDAIGTFDGQGSSSNIQRTRSLLVRHTGTGANLGKVRIRFSGTGLTSSTLHIDQIFTSYAVVSQTVGYAGGMFWLNTVEGTAGTEIYVNGAADKPASTLADIITMQSTIPLHDIHVSSDSTFAPTGDFNNNNVIGIGYTATLGGHDYAGTHIYHASPLSGIATTAGTSDHFDVLNSIITTVTTDDFHATNCIFTDTLTLGTSGIVSPNVNINHCKSGIAGATAPVITKTTGATLTMSVRDWNGGLTISGLESGDTITIDGTFGTVTLNGADATVEVRGTAKAVTNNLTGSPSVNTDGLLIGKDLSDTLADTNELQTNQGNWLTATGFATETKQDIIDTNVDAILVDTGTTLPATLTAQDAVIDNLNSGIIYGSAATGTLTTTVATTDLTGYADDQLIGRVIVVLTGNAAGEATDITAYANASGQLTFTALTVAMANSDTFKIV